MSNPHRDRRPIKPTYVPIEVVKHTTCPDDQKHAFASQEEAFSAALSASRGKGKPFRAYECPTRPGKWHITSRARRVGDRFEK